MILLGFVTLAVLAILIDAILRMSAMERRMKDCPSCLKWMERNGFTEEKY